MYLLIFIKLLFNDYDTIILGDRMDFKNILDMKSNPTEVFFGYINNNLLKLDLKEYSSIIITGSTGTSKSVMINQILLQLINKNNSNDLKLVTINPTKVELKPYRLTKYAYNKQIDLECHNFNEIIKMMESRIDLFKEYEVNNFDDYNDLYYKSKLPIIVIAIDEATFLLEKKDSDEKLRWIINHCKELGIIFIMTTNNIYNNFFTKGYNSLADIRISFDFVTKEDAKMTNLSDCENLSLDEFIIEVNNRFNQQTYKSFRYEDNTLENILKSE